MTRDELNQLAERLRSMLDDGRKIDAINEYVAATAAPLPDAAEFIESLILGHVISAIKLHRQATGAGLAEGKELVLRTARPSGQPGDSDDW